MISAAAEAGAVMAGVADGVKGGAAHADPEAAADAAADIKPNSNQKAPTCAGAFFVFRRFFFCRHQIPNNLIDSLAAMKSEEIWPGRGGKIRC